jgi:poly(3-hydroxybutyrate) depolymerase
MARPRTALALATLLAVAALVPAIPELLERRSAAPADATGLTGRGLVDASGGEPEVVRLQVGTRSRAYLLARARRVQAGAGPALLVVLPASNRTVQETFGQLGLDALRDHGLTVAVASALDGWNAGTCCGGAATAGVDDVGAVRAAVEDATRRAGTDPARVALLGYSTGGFMVYRLLCEGALQVRAAVEVAGSLATACREPRRLPPVLALHGTEDATVPLGPSTAPVTILGTVPLGVREAVRRLSLAGGCTPTSCPVRLVEVPGAGHRWEDLDAVRRVAEFLSSVVPGVR